MDYRKLALYFALAIVGVFLWNTWMRDYPPSAVKQAQSTQQGQQAQTSQKGQTYTPSTFSPGTTVKQQPVQQQMPSTQTGAAQSKQLVSVKTDVLDVKIDLKGGNIVSASLPKYPLSLETPNLPIKILKPNPNKIYIAQAGLTNVGVKRETKPIQYTTSQKSVVLKNGSKLLKVVLQGKTENGLHVTKTFTFQNNDYAITVKYKITNNSGKVWEGSVFNQIIRRNVPTPSSLHSRSYDGGAISSPQTPYEKLPYKKLNTHNVNRNIQGGWIAMQQKYFLSTWVPDKNLLNHYYSHVQIPPNSDGESSVYTLGYVSPVIKLKPGESAVRASTFYVGPEIAKRLAKLAKGLELTVDYGWLAPISRIIFWVMTQIHHVVGNWGWSIILVTLLIKILFYPLADKSYKSMTKMRELAPRIQAMKERYGDDKQAMSKATMELYRKEKVNPMSSCLPMLIQVPVFIALYWVLIESVQLRQAPFMFWIQDLSVKDPYFVLPILMGLSMLLQQKMSPPPPDPTQAKVMMLLPVVFTVFFLSFPAGLVLYWLTNNVLSVLQQWYVMKTYDPKKAALKKKKKKK